MTTTTATSSSPANKGGIFGLFRKARNMANAPTTRYGLELIASKAIEQKVGQPDGILENILQYVWPKYYNAYKLGKIYSPKRSVRMLATLVGMAFPRRFPALVAASQSGGKLTLVELLGIWLAPDVVLAANAFRKDVFTGANNARKPLNVTA